MTGPHRLYRFLIRLYPREFRQEYGEDLVAHYADLVAQHGARAARSRTALDLIVTIPRYHLEHVMNERHSTSTLTITIGLLAVAGVASVMTDLYPGAILFVVAVVLAIAQRSTLARAIRTPDTNLRRRRLLTAAILAVISVGSYAIYSSLIGDNWGVRETVLTIIGTLALIGAPGYFIAGLLTPRTPDSREAPQPAA